LRFIQLLPPAMRAKPRCVRSEIEAARHCVEGAAGAELQPALLVWLLKPAPQANATGDPNKTVMSL